MRELSVVRVAFRRKLDTVVAPSIGRDLLWSEFLAALDDAEHAGYRRGVQQARERLTTVSGPGEPPVPHHPV